MGDIRCSKCRATKPAAEFPPDTSRPSGLYPQCRPCRNETRRDSYARKKANANVTPMARPPRDLDKVPSLLDPPPSDRPRMGPYLAELERTLATLELREVDAALVGLCRGLARGMDGTYGDPRELALISPKYLAALKALCVTRDSAAPAAQETASPLRVASY